ncbi:MAG: sulfite exporter TauE/SafE family protein [Chloroflexota bacterium]|nr:sulfite exporter TauE/SafE family protein [Chloroflexota bacterium]
MVPLFTGQLRLSQHRAHGTSLAVITFVAIAGALGYWRAGNIDWRLVAAFVPGSVVGVYAGASAMTRVPALQLRLLFGAFLFFVAFRQLVWHVSAGGPQTGVGGLLIEGAFGFAGGLLAGILGVGGGAIFVPAILIFGLAHTSAGHDPQKIAQGVSLVVIIATGAAGTLTNLRQDMIDVDIVKWVVPGAVLAAFLASVVANRLDGDVLKVVYGLTALFLGCQIFYSTIRAYGPRMMEQTI